MTARTIALPMATLLLCPTLRAWAVQAEKAPAADSRSTIDPARFSARVTNEYFTLAPRKKMIYELKTEDGVRRVESYVTTEKDSVMGVECTVVRDRVWTGSTLVEDTRHYFAEDDQGNVWDFGGSSKDSRGGKGASTEVSWEAGEGGAQPGIVMLAHPASGATMQRESGPGKAAGRAEVIGLDETITVPYGELIGCLRTRESSPADPTEVKHRCYCPKVGGIALAADPTGGEEMRLVSVEYDAPPTPEGAVPQPAKPGHRITEEQAKAIALLKVPGKITEVSIERKFGKLAYVIEIQVKGKPETDVIIDIETGEVLGTEM